MGTDIHTDRFTPADYVEFKRRLQTGLVALERVLGRPGFGGGSRSMGVELELFLIDRGGRPLPISQAVVEDTASPLVTPEMGAFDIELSTPPVELTGRPLSALAASMHESIGLIRTRARRHAARVVPVSILPTFHRQDFHPGTITDLSRYRALSAGLCRLRQGPFHICIDGEEPLDLRAEDVAMEAANIAFQVHLRAEPAEFARLFNAALMLTGPVIAASGNSPTFLGHRLWEETRVVLFKQAGDDRPETDNDDFRLPARIGFGNGWVRDGAAELFRESVALHEPILPVCGDQDDLAAVDAGEAPLLEELRLHHGTVWKWNRPVYDPADGGHLRIELRALPSGPTVDDMLANASFLVGGILALAPTVGELLPSFPFALAEKNFYRAARYGLNAEMAWPVRGGAAPEVMGAKDLLSSLIPKAREGLLAAGVDITDVARFTDIFQQRVHSGMTGAVWQRRTLESLLRRGEKREEALRLMLERYIAEFEAGSPVHTWQPLG